MAENNQKNKIKDYYKNFPFWEHLTDNEKQLVLNRMAVVKYNAGQLLQGAYRDCLGLTYIISGILRVSLLSLDGREITLFRVRENELCIFSSSCALDAISFETQISAEEDCECLLLPIDVFSQLMENNIYVQRDSYKLTSERFNDIVGGLERLVFMSIEQRLVSFLLDESSDTKSDVIHMTHEQIAVNILSAREVVSRSLKAMAKKGWLELSRGTITLLDKDTLYKLL